MTAESPFRVLPSFPTEIAPGIRAWRNYNGLAGVLLHYSSDPETASQEERRLVVPGDESRYLRENELDFTSFAGKAVFPGFDQNLHVDPNIGYLPEYPVWCGIDFGWHHPAAVFGQVGPELWVLGEVMGEDMTLEDFLNKVFFPYRDKIFPPSAKWLYAADPAGRQVSDKSEHTSFAILSNHGIFPVQKKSEINEGLTIIRQRLGLGLMKVHPRCRILIEGLKGGYRYPEPTPGRPEPLLPKKDGFYDHVADSFRYMCVNAISLLTPKREEKRPDKTAIQKLMARHEHIVPKDDLELLNI